MYARLCRFVNANELMRCARRCLRQDYSGRTRGGRSTSSRIAEQYLKQFMHMYKRDCLQAAAVASEKLEPF